MGPRSKPQKRARALHHDKSAEHFSSSKHRGNGAKNNYNDISKKPPPPKSSFSSSSNISINLTKSKIRNVRRALEHSQESMPPGIRIEKERALAGYMQDLDRAVEEKKRNEMIAKYHMVRFFERKKAERALKKARARLLSSHGTMGDSGKMRERAADGEEDNIEEMDRGGSGEAGKSKGQEESAVRQVHIAEVDVNYTIYYPLTEKYISLYPKSTAGDPSSSNPLEKSIEDGGKAESASALTTNSNLPKPPIWPFIEQCMSSGTLDQLRNGRYGIQPDGRVKTRAGFAALETTNRSDRHHHRDDERSKGKSKNFFLSTEDGAAEAESDDGGFFVK